MDLETITLIYRGSNGEATSLLYRQLEARKPLGTIAMDVFRAMKASERAKVYHGGNQHGSYRDLAYQKKQWSLSNLCSTLLAHAAPLELTWGWREDPEQDINRWVLYLDLPTGQVSFHSPVRGDGPIYTAAWDGVRFAGPGRICTWCAALLAVEPIETVAS